MMHIGAIANTDPTTARRQLHTKIVVISVVRPTSVEAADPLPIALPQKQCCAAHRGVDVTRNATMIMLIKTLGVPIDPRVTPDLSAECRAPVRLSRKTRT